MIGVVCWIIILLGLSGWQAQSASGDISLVKWKNGKSYGSWDTQICKATPYSYLTPFSFTFQQFNTTTTTSKSGAKSSSKTIIYQTAAKTICAWPDQNSSLRFVICVFGLLSVLALFFKTRFSVLARTVTASYALLFFAAFVLDSNSSGTGFAECQNGFINTNFNADLASANVILTCNQDDFGGLAVVDLLLSGLFFLLHTAWGMCKNLYGDGTGAEDNKDLKNIGLDESTA